MFPKSQKEDSGFHYFGILFIIWVIVGGFFLLWEKNREIYLWINKNNNALGDFIFPNLSALGTFLGVVICLVVLLISSRKFRNIRFLLVFIICNLIPFIVVQVLKNIFNAPRPLNYFESADWIHRIAGQPENYHLSFPSGHSAGVFALCCFSALLVPKRWSGIGILLFFLALSTAYSRIYLSQHFFADVYAGSIIGVICVYFVFKYLENTRLKI